MKLSKNKIEKINNFCILSNPNFAYIIGFIQADGNIHLSKNKKYYRLSIELSEIDSDILKKIKKIIPIKGYLRNRTRTGGFSKNSKFVSLRYSNNFLIQKFIDNGIPIGRKSEIISKPQNFDLCESDYFRGLLDGDASFGMKFSSGKKRPYISYTSNSKQIVLDFLNFCKKFSNTRTSITIKKKSDKYALYAVTISGYSAIKILSRLYYADNCLCLNRKKIKAQEAMSFKCKKEIIFYSKKEDKFILNNSIELSIKKLKRTRQSINYRLNFLKKKMCNR